jgi:release factor glutamine methyltransferase
MDGIVARLRSAGCVFAEDEARLLRAEASTPAQLEALVARRLAGEPLEHVLGWAEFRGLRLSIEPGVFVPRHRTELLVEQAVARARPGQVALDLCCGCGAIAAALAAAVPGLEVHAADADPIAVRCAARNVQRVYCGHLFDPIPAGLRGRVDILTANVPYVPSDQIALMPPEARDHEPRIALDGGPDGLDLLRLLAAQAPAWLAPGGHLFTETGAAQASTAVSVLEAAGLRADVLADEDATVVIARTG